MKNIWTTLILGILFLFTGCVSVNLPTSSKTEKAKDLSITKPENPFVQIKVEGADQAWISAKTGNTISYISECGASSDKSLETMQTETLASLNQTKIVSNNSVDIDGREGLEVLAEGKVDGVEVKLNSLSFKKNGCSYTITYGGTEKNFANEIEAYTKFKTGFKVP